MMIKRLLLSICASFMLIGCSNNSAKTPVELKIVDNYHGEYEVGFPIDVENFFYYSDRSQVSINVSYDKHGLATTEEISGNTFFPKYSGEYLFTCSSSTKSLNKRIEVVDSKPTLNVKDAACFVGTGKEIYFVEIFSEIPPTYSPSTADLEVFNVQYAPYTFDIAGNLTEPLVDYDFTNVGFTPKNPGLYRVHIRIVNGVKSVEGVINVVAARSKSDGNDNVYKFDDGTYASNKVVISNSSKDTFVLPASVYSEASYVTLKPEFKNGDSIGIRFKGKNIPSVGLLASPSLSGSYAINSIYGYLLSFERRFTNRFTLYCPMNATTYKDGQASRDELLGVDDLEEDKYYYLTASLVGNTPSGSKILHAVHWSICEIENYGTINEHYSKPIKQIDSSGGWTDDYDVSSGRVVLYSSENRDIVVQIDGMPDQGDIVQFGGRKHEGVNKYTFENTTVKNNLTTGNTATVNGYLAFKGQYTAGDSVSYTFKGYNIPGVCLFCDTISGLTGGGQGLYIMPGNGDRSLNKRLTFYGPYRYDSSNPEGYMSPDGANSSYQGIGWNYRVYNALNSPFALDNLTDDGEYLYTIKIIRANVGEVIITTFLYDMQYGRFDLIADETYFIYCYTGPTSGSIIAYPGFLGMSKTTTFSSYPVNTSPIDDEDFFTYRASYEVLENKTNVHLDEPVYPENNSVRLKDISYLGVKDACEVGKTIKVNFTGKNIPNICLFSDSVDGQAIGGGRGVYLCTSFQQVSENPPLGAAANQHKLMPYAPYRWSPTNKFQDDKYAFDNLTGFRYNSLGNATQNKGFGYLDAEDGVNYEYKVTINSLSSSSINFNARITNVDNPTALDYSNTFNLVFTTPDSDGVTHTSLGERVGLGPNLIFYGQGAETNFSYAIE